MDKKLLSTMLLMAIMVFFPGISFGMMRIPGPGGKAPVSTPTLDAAFDFRNTLAYVSDPTGYAYADSAANAAWPFTYFPTGGGSYYAGWNENIGSCTNTASGNNDSISGDARLAGQRYASSVQCAAFNVLLPHAGTYNVNLAFKGGLNQSTFKIYDGYGAISGLATSAAGAGGACGSATGTITWASGTNAGFTSDMLASKGGTLLTYNGVSYTICSLAGEVATVTPNPGTQSSHAWSYGTTASLLTSQTNVAIPSGSVLDSSGNVTTQANWVSASAYGGVANSLTFSTNVLQIQYGLSSSGSSPYSALSNLSVWH